MPTDWGKLLPVNVAREVIASATQQSAVLSLARVQRMPTGVEQIPVVSALPTAGWVEAGARKPISNVEWSAATLVAKEIACIVPVPDVYLADTTGSWNVGAVGRAGASGRCREAPGRRGAVR